MKNVTGESLNLRNGKMSVMYRRGLEPLKKNYVLFLLSFSGKKVKIITFLIFVSDSFFSQDSVSRILTFFLRSNNLKVQVFLGVLTHKVL